MCYQPQHRLTLERAFVKNVDLSLNLFLFGTYEVLRKIPISGHQRYADCWWEESKYFQWIGKQNSYKICDMPVDIKVAITELTKKALPIFQYARLLATRIMDNIND